MTTDSSNLLRSRLAAYRAKPTSQVYLLYGNDEPEADLIRAADNMPELLVANAKNVNVHPLLKNQFCIMDKKAVEVLEELYKID